MKKTLLSVLALFTFALCNAQVKTQSNYDVDGNGKVTIEDVTSTVSKVLGNRTLVDGESLNALQKEHELVMKKLGADPYNGHEYVDLGLPSGLKWATCNLGAENPEDYGCYYAWGATEPQDEYDWVHCPFQTQNAISYSSTKFTKYLGSTSSSHKDPSATDANALKTVLDPEDDAAHVNWGGDWRMPTKEEQDELLTKCTWTWKSQNGVNGYTVVGPNGNSLFLPAAGERYISIIDHLGHRGNYWSSSLELDSSDHAYYLNFYSDGCGWYGSHRAFGYAVRPVCQ